MNVKILPQPDDVTCGPTSLHAIYHHYGYQISLHRLISEIEMLEGGGTLGVFLGLDALKRGDFFFPVLVQRFFVDTDDFFDRCGKRHPVGL